MILEVGGSIPLAHPTLTCPRYSPPARAMVDMTPKAAGHQQTGKPVGHPRATLALAGILIIAAAVRLYFMRDWLNYDESMHYLVTMSPLGEDFVREFRLRAHPPLSYLAMKPLLVASGGSTSAAWVRAVPFVAGLAGVAIAFNLLRRVTQNLGAATLGALVISLVPVLVQQSIIVRSYSLALLFLWLGLALALRIQSDRDEILRNHIGLALVQVGALFSEYTTLTAVIPLSLIVYLPLTKKLFRRRQLGRLVELAALQLAAAGSALAIFLWHFGGLVPSFPHTEGATFLGGTDFAAMGSFLGMHFPLFIAGLLDGPWGYGLLALAWLPLTPLLQRHPHAKVARQIALYSALSVLLLLLLTLGGLLPLGGPPRHVAALLPGLFASAIIAATLAVELLFRAGAPRRVAALLLVAIAVGACVQGLDRLSQFRNSYYTLSDRGHVSEYRSNPAPMAVNNRARSLLSWWFLPERTPRRSSYAMLSHQFDYEGIPVLESPNAAKLLVDALTLVRQYGRAWILYSNLKNDADLSNTYKVLQQGLAADPSVRVLFAQKNDLFVIPSIIIGIEKILPPDRRSQVP